MSTMTKGLCPTPYACRAHRQGSSDVRRPTDADIESFFEI
ncbi:hypothetical protein TPChic_0538a [Treponema pallidum subsp. pallidum str. Chicago]|nr:hypothetical protein TPChic_0538a [Treponema pallidum subsp. pallidum str. Chicago]